MRDCPRPVYQCTTVKCFITLSQTPIQNFYNILGYKNFVGWNDVGSKVFWSQKIPKKIGPRKFWNMKNYGSQTKFESIKKIGSWKILSYEKFQVLKNVGSKTKLYVKKKFILKLLGFQKFLFQKKILILIILGLKKFLGHKKHLDPEKIWV